MSIIKQSEFNKISSELLSETMQKFNNRPGEYSIVLNPVSRAKLEFALKVLMYDSVEELLMNQAEKLFEQAVIKTIAEQRGKSITNNFQLEDVIKDMFNL